MATRIEVQLPGEISYDVRVGPGVLRQLGESLCAIERLAEVHHVLIITDETVGPLYESVVKEALTTRPVRISEITIPTGEQSKSLEVVHEIWEAMAHLNLGRDCAVIALGGGVVGDVAGFVASTYMRGVVLIQAPTTLLAMVDSSIGGKTAVNLDVGKNLVGTFFQPTFVCADTDVLTTLSDSDWKSGCGEIAKTAIIDSDDFFFWLVEHAAALSARDALVVDEAIVRCVVGKADIVARDTTEHKGVRTCLNLGHTLGHALEVASGYETFSHGEAVAEGIRFAAYLSEMVLGAEPDFVQAQSDLLDELGLQKRKWEIDPAVLLKAMKHDKKIQDSRVKFVLAVDVGRWELASISDADIISYLQTWQQGMGG